MPKSNRPSHRALVNLGDETQKIWREVGALWPHRDGQGFTLKLDLIPTSGREIVIRAIKDDERDTAITASRNAVARRGKRCVTASRGNPASRAANRNPQGRASPKSAAVSYRRANGLTLTIPKG